MRSVSLGLSRGARVFSILSPGLPSVFKLKWIKALFAVKSIAKQLYHGNTADEICGSILAGAVLSRATKEPKRLLKKAHMAAQIRGKRTLMNPYVLEFEKDRNGRIIRKAKMMLHDANKAKKHIDLHLGRTSLIYRITGKAVEKKIKYNNKGELTEDAKKALMKHVRNEVASHARVAQNLDHSKGNAALSWLVGEKAIEGYGSGVTRQVVAEGDIELYHHSVDSSMHIYAPFINPNQGLYLYQIYPGTDTGTPICILGNLIPRDLKFDDRLHLKLIQPEDLAKFKEKCNLTTVTRKYDGASTHFWSNGQGFKFFSPRMSKETGHRIEYTYKVPELAEKGHASQPVGMGELMFYRKTQLGTLLELFGLRGPEKLAWNYIPASQIGGILNGQSVRPKDIYPELRLYRIDRHSGVRTGDLPFFDNRVLQKNVAMVNPRFIKVVGLCHPKQVKGWEGLVGVPDGTSVNQGYKLKWWGDEYDWKVTKNELKLNERGNIEGVLWFRSLDSGKEFKLGPGQIGSFDENMRLLGMQGKAIGLVAKIHGREGHEGRAAKLVAWHMDKGIG